MTCDFLAWCIFGSELKKCPICGFCGEPPRAIRWGFAIVRFLRSYVYTRLPARDDVIFGLFCNIGIKTSSPFRCSLKILIICGNSKRLLSCKAEEPGGNKRIWWAKLTAKSAKAANNQRRYTIYFSCEPSPVFELEAGWVSS